MKWCKWLKIFILENKDLFFLLISQYYTHDEAKQGGVILSATIVLI